MGIIIAGKRFDGGGGNLFRVVVQTPLHLAAVNGNMGRGLAAEADLAAVDGQKGDLSLITMASPGWRVRISRVFSGKAGLLGQAGWGRFISFGRRYSIGTLLA